MNNTSLLLRGAQSNSRAWLLRRMSTAAFSFIRMGFTQKLKKVTIRISFRIKK